ncbi:DUF1153 domain-containing protein [Hwanghaeella grinnelliae]|nr:DUF1153 domain-containing protein [Hwanghaeella grinnelliae]
MTSHFKMDRDEEEAQLKADTSVVQFPGAGSAEQNRTQGHARTTGPGLPPPNLRRWTSQYKQAVVLAVHGGFLTQAEACKRYRLTAEEFQDWEYALTRHGAAGLKVTRLSGLRRVDKQKAG